MMENFLEFLKKDFKRSFRLEKSSLDQKKEVIALIFFCSFLTLLFGFLTGAFFGKELQELLSLSFLSPLKSKHLSFTKSPPSFLKNPPLKYTPQASHEQAVIDVVNKSMGGVVSIIISKEVPIYKKYYINPFKDFEEFFGPSPFFEFEIPQYKKEGTKKEKIGGGTGFIVSKDGLVLTNKHVVYDENAEYTIITQKGERYSAKVLAKDPFKDLAILKIEKGNKEITFPTLPLGNSDNLQIGQTVIAIGYALGEFSNTVSVGVISGLGRTITAGGRGIIETLEDVIQTDAAINPGNSGGPLLNLRGEVIGVNVAMAQGAQNIGFAIPINQAKKAILDVIKKGKIIYPFLGIRYILITPEIKQESNLAVDYGALIVSSKNSPAIVPGSAAEKAGLKEGDIILEINGEKITQRQTLSKLIRKYNPGDKITLKVLRGKKILKIKAVLGERTSG